MRLPAELNGSRAAKSLADSALFNKTIRQFVWALGAGIATSNYQKQVTREFKFEFIRNTFLSRNTVPCNDGVEIV